MNREYLYVKWGSKEGDDMGSELRRVGELIHDYRKRAGFTLHQLSALSGVPKGTISKIERGETKHPELDTVLALSSPLSISYEDVVNHYVVMEKRKNILHHMLLEAVRVSDMNIIAKVAARFLECDGVDSYDLVEELYNITGSVTDEMIKLGLFELLAKYAREHGIQPFVAKALFQKYLIERNDFSKLDLTFQAGTYLLLYVNFLSEEEKVLLHFKLGFHAYALQLYEKCIHLCTYIIKENDGDRLTKARALLLICNSYYYLGEYFMAEQYLCECKKYPFPEIQENIKLNEAAIQGKKGNRDHAILQLKICLDQSSPNTAIHVINELLELYLHSQDIDAIEQLIEDESRILNAQYNTPFKKSELALYFKLKAGYFILKKRFEDAIDCYTLSALHYVDVNARIRANDCFNLIVFILPVWARKQVAESSI
ncbi:helix-turn-helix domain-containing protein [Paenibacillus apiarius]|uniref:Helix-turn-helix domain-containing protein n=1 Tax=Paenibacillus apiarius TaxID=46240 RepID=A0ABT4DRV8_9BACL|nr:helix-turn-helix transcriptional regulator [Paenibacillus apiarius]MCY9515267.1 helix-turn-helix domain-containing protein [Paenibacillus apiarius]MCY9520016.1 helix-turn-helix domain-containing protein [Paenibacillus apiarius]MCY9554361.1 helix-turn-helix domain-containing protein [Paenibacillus apiarius]MCY9558152.1 helix-turn-helix domain-containing protein [Paenibacillus apiarius]MCY9684947.1 helix-turn-helix domain-containing protein [Paenibacillus apiarius]